MSKAKGRTEQREREREGNTPFGNVEGNVNQLGRYFQTIRLIVKLLDVDDDVREYFNGIKENYLGIAFDFDDKLQRGRQFLRQLRA